MVNLHLLGQIIKIVTIRSVWSGGQAQIRDFEIPARINPNRRPFPSSGGGQRSRLVLLQ
jgi:hypothetical protein